MAACGQHGALEAAGGMFSQLVWRQTSLLWQWHRARGSELARRVAVAVSVV